MSDRSRVWSFSLGDPASVAQQVRLIGPLSYLPEDRFEYTYAPSWRALTRLGHPPDVAVFHRNFYPFREIRKITAAQRRRGGKSVIDLDDLLTEVPQDHLSYAAYQPLRAEILEVIASVDALSVTNARLKARYAPHNPDITILPNLLDERIWGPFPAPKPPADERCVIGYAGDLQHARELGIVEPALKHALQKYGAKVELKFIGFVPEGLRGLPRVSGCGVIRDYRRYVRALKESAIDIAVVPLKDEPLNECKSNIKYLDFSACAIPGAYSRVGPYIDTATNGKNALLVPNEPDAWVAAVERLVEDPGLRAELGRAAARLVAADYSLRAKAGLWADFYARLSPRPSSGASLEPYVSYGPYIAYSLLRGRA